MCGPNEKPPNWPTAKRSISGCTRSSTTSSTRSNAPWSGVLEPVFKETYLGTAEVRNTFRVPKVGAIAGCYITDGKITRQAEIRLLRDNVVIFEGKIASLKRFKEDASEVARGYECGIGIQNFNDVKVGDIIEAFVTESVMARRSLVPGPDSHGDNRLAYPRYPHPARTVSQGQAYGCATAEGSPSIQVQRRGR